MFDGGFLNPDDTLKVTVKIENEENGNKVEISKNIDVIQSTDNKFKADSLLAAVEKYDFADGEYEIEVEDEVYNIRVYSYTDNLEISSGTQSFGTPDDVGKSDTYAKNMVVLKVKGDITIDSGATLTAYSSLVGYGGPKGFLIYCTGTLTNNGTITMTAKGAYAEGQNVYLWKNADGSYETVPKVGGAGADRLYLKYSYGARDGIAGSPAPDRGTGGRRIRNMLCIWRRSLVRSWICRNIIFRTVQEEVENMVLDMEMMPKKMGEQEEQVMPMELEIQKEEQVDY